VVSGEYCTIPNGTAAPGKLLICPPVALDPVPISVSTWPAGLATNGGLSARAARGAPISITPTTAVASSTVRGLRNGIAVSRKRATCRQ
jgi:hypothetical protein